MYCQLNIIEWIIILLLLYNNMMLIESKQFIITTYIKKQVENIIYKIIDIILAYSNRAIWRSNRTMPNLAIQISLRFGSNLNSK